MVHIFIQMWLIYLESVETTLIMSLPCANPKINLKVVQDYLAMKREMLRQGHPYVLSCLEMCTKVH